MCSWHALLFKCNEFVSAFLISQNSISFRSSLTHWCKLGWKSVGEVPTPIPSPFHMVGSQKWWERGIEPRGILEVYACALALLMQEQRWFFAIDECGVVGLMLNAILVPVSVGLCCCTCGFGKSGILVRYLIATELVHTLFRTKSADSVTVSSRRRVPRLSRKDLSWNSEGRPWESAFVLRGNRRTVGTR